MKADYDTFTITRSFKCTPAQLFAAWADPKAKFVWFTGPEGWVLSEQNLDFKEGGTELLRGVFPGRLETCYTANYYDIVENERISYAFQVRLNSEIYSVSSAVVEFTPDAGGTKMEFTEQIFYLDGDRAAETTPNRIKGTNEHYDRLDKYLA